MRSSIVLILINIVICVTTSYATTTLDMPHNSGKLIGKHIEYLEDKTNKLTINDIIENNFTFIKSNYEFLDFGYNKSAFWFHVKINNKANKPTVYYFDYNYNMLSKIDFFYLQKNNLKKIHLERHGEFNQSNTTPFANALSFEVEPGTVDIYIRVKTIGNYYIGFKFYTELDFILKKDRSQLVIGVVLGIILFMILFNLNLFFNTKEIFYLIMIGLLSFATVLWLLHQTTLLYIFHPPILKKIYLCSVFSMHALIILLIFSFKGTRPYLKKLIRFLSYILPISAPILGVAFYTNFYTAVRIIVIFAFISVNIMYFSALKFFKDLQIFPYVMTGATLYYFHLWLEMLFRLKIFKPFFAPSINWVHLVDLININVLMQPLSLIIINFGIIRLNSIMIHKKRIEAEEKYYSKLKQETNLKNVFIKNTAHQIVTPTQNIMCIMDELNFTQLPTDVKNKFSTIKNEISNLYQIITEFSLSEAKDITQNDSIKEISPKLLIMEIISSINIMPEIAELCLKLEDFSVIMPIHQMKDILTKIIQISSDTTSKNSKVLIILKNYEQEFKIIIADNGDLLDNTSNTTIEKKLRMLNGNIRIKSPIPKDINLKHFRSDNLCGKAFYLSFLKN